MQSETLFNRDASSSHRFYRFGPRNSTSMKLVLIFALVSTVLSVNTVSPTNAIAEPIPSDRQLAVSNARADDPFAEGYQIGYRMGLDQGREFRTTNVGYSPQILGIGGEEEDETDRRAAIGYQAGFLAGFHDGYYNSVSTPSQSEIERFNEGYSQGYDAGLNDALLCRQALNCSYNPTPASDEPEDAQYDVGYKVGYWQAFEKAWTSKGQL